MPTEQRGFSVPNQKDLKDYFDQLKSESALPELSFGQKLVGLTFNPSGDDKVSKAKSLCAELAELVMNDLAEDANPSYLYNLIKGKALGEVLSAQMLVVKLLTLKY